MAFDFKSKTIVVTGAGRGLGRAAVIALVNSGAHVIAVSRTQSTLETLKEEVPPGSVVTITVDLADWNATRAALEPILAKVPVDGLINNAAVSKSESFLTLTKENLERVINVNFIGVINVAQIVAQAMVRDKRPGSIVNVSSQASLAALENHTTYGSCKAAVDQATRNMALELGPYGIRVNTVNPTVVLTEMSRAHWLQPQRKDLMLSKIPLRRFAEVEEVVDAFLFLLSDKSTMITGSSLPVDGGFLAT